LCVTEITQTPGAIVSAAGIETQTLLATTLGARVTGSADEQSKRLSLHIASDKNVEVIGWWPKAWGVPKVMIAGKELAASIVSFGPETFVRFPVPKGEADVAVSE
jgi:hypothetical protein